MSSGQVSLFHKDSPDLQAKPAPRKKRQISYPSSTVLSRLLVAGHYFPTTILVDDKWKYVSHLGPADRYLDFEAGGGKNIAALARGDVAPALCAALHDAREHKTGLASWRVQRGGYDYRLDIEVETVVETEQELFLIFFVEHRIEPRVSDGPTQVAAWDPLHAGNTLTASSAAGALDKDFQSEWARYRDDLNFLKDVLRSAAMPILVLDANLLIRAFTPSAAAIFRAISSDIGRPLADLRPMLANDSLLEDARTVLRTGQSQQAEIEGESGVCYRRHLAPCYDPAGAIEGLIITLIELSGHEAAFAAQQHAARQKQEAVLRYVDHASREQHAALRTLQEFVRRRGDIAEPPVDETLGSVEEIANTLQRLVDVTLGKVEAARANFPLRQVIDGVRTKLSAMGATKAVDLRLVSGETSVYSDPRLLEEMICHLLAIAAKSFCARKVVIGVRTRAGQRKLEISWSASEHHSDDWQRLFAELNAERPNVALVDGFGLDLPLVQQLQLLLRDRLRIGLDAHSRVVATVDLKQTDGDLTVDGNASALSDSSEAILIVDSDDQRRDALRSRIEQYGHRVLATATGTEALAAVADTTHAPRALLVAYRLTPAMTGPDFIARLRQSVRRDVPAILIDVSGAAPAPEIDGIGDCTVLRDPLHDANLFDVIRSVCGDATPVGQSSGHICVIGGDDPTRGDLRRILLQMGQAVEEFQTAEAFLDAEGGTRARCVLVDLDVPGMDQAQLRRVLRARNEEIPLIVMAGRNRVFSAIEALRLGASDFIEKPIDPDSVIASVRHAIARPTASPSGTPPIQNPAPARLAQLTARQQLILQFVLEGEPSKLIAFRLGISQRTVENHRAVIMRKLGAKSLARLARIAFSAGWKPEEP